jgi:fucose permease
MSGGACGGALFPFLMGLASQRAGIRPAFVFAPALAALAGALLLRARHNAASGQKGQKKNRV